MSNPSNPINRITRSRPATMALAAAAAFALALVLVSTPRPAAALEQPPVDIDNLDLVPLRTWGVSGQDPTQTQTSSLDVLVWDFAQIGDRMFVGGGFLNVQESKDATPIPQSFVAAFDVRTGEWIDTWRPRLDRIVYSLEVFDGSLVVGGEFVNVNGERRQGLVALDPITGEIDRSFAGSVDRPWSSNRAMVRDMEVQGETLYVVGNFSHLDGVGGTRERVYNAGRFVSFDGRPDPRWKPEVTGSSAWGVVADPGRGEVHMTGFFSAVNGEQNSGYFHTVNDIDGATAPGKKDLPRNYPRAQPEMFDVAMGDGLVFVAGEQHIVQMLRPSDQEMIGYAHTGYDYDGFEWRSGFAGGAYQVAERVGDYVFSGCHCTFSERYGILSHYSSVTGRRTPHRLVMAYEADTGALAENFMPDIHSPRDGTWAVASDTNGCLWLGGDFHVGGVDSGRPHWLGGFAHICEQGFDPNAQPDPEPDGSVLIPAGSEWRYDDSGRDLGEGWNDPAFDDGAWKLGPAEFGFGEQNLGTEVQPGFVTYYFRHSFNLDGPIPESLEVKLRDDDGAIVRLNGVELVRDNLPDGFVSASTPASDWKGGDQENFASYTVPSEALTGGENVVTVEVHNVWSGNADLRFDLELVASDAAAPDPVATDLVVLGSEWQHTDSSGQSAPANWPAGLDGQPVAPAPFGFGEGDEATVVAEGQETYYFAYTFAVEDRARWGDTLNLDLVVDDGAVVYLNGVELWRQNMPDGPIAWNTRPVNWVSGPDEDLKTFTVSADALQPGDNVVTVEVHNYWPGNNDLSFDLGLR